jgi:hypothetical protein
MRTSIRGILAGLALAVAALVGPGMAQAQSQLSIGGEAAGRLQDGDQTLDSGEYVDVWTFRGRAGQQVTINMSSTDVDAYLMLRGPAGLSEWNDDRASGETNARLTVRLPADGLYRISATTFEPGENGEYLISVIEGAGPASGQEGGGEIAIGQAGQGRLALGDDRLDAGEFVDRWTFRGTPGETYVVRLNSAAFDPYLLVRGEGLEADNDDDASGRGAVNSRLEFVMPADGEVRIFTTSYQPDETGDYALVLAEAGAEQAAPVAVATTSTLTLGQTVGGRLDDGAPTLRSGEFVTSYALRGRAGEQIELRMRSADFDSYLFMTGPGEFSATNDDDDSGEDGVNSRLIVTLPADGEYQVYATSFEPGERGDYALSAARPSDAAVTAQADAAMAAFDDGVLRDGVLAPGDRSQDGAYADRFQFSGRRGARIALTAESDAFDTTLFLRGPGGAEADNDDGPDGTNSRIDFVLPADGVYDVTVSSFEGGQTGPYRLTAGLSLGTPRQASVPGGPRVFAVMVGISDYGGYASNLAYTADDAIKLAEDLRRDGLLNPASVVLTDAGATVAGVRAAFAQVAAQAGPNDIFLFFYSGHGSQVRGAASAVELDGMTETIVMVDGQISDAEMAQMFASVSTRMSMIVLDSCFSGGFARNVVSRAGIIGLFSSEEDLTSQVAVKFQAGGYLSHFVRTGLGGEANADGDDMITAGELTQYVRRKYATEVTAYDVGGQTIDGQRSYQNLVVERGGVQVDDVVVRVERG